MWPAVESLDQLSSGQGLDVEPRPSLAPDPRSVFAVPIFGLEPNEGEVDVVPPRRLSGDVEVSDELEDDRLPFLEDPVDLELDQPVDHVLGPTDLLAVGVEAELWVRARAFRHLEGRVLPVDAVAVAVRRARPPTEQDPGVAVLDELLAGELGLALGPRVDRDALDDVRAGVVADRDDHRLELDRRTEREARGDGDADDELVPPVDRPATDEDRARRRKALGSDVRLVRRTRARATQAAGLGAREDSRRLAGAEPADLEGHELAGHHRADVEPWVVRGEHSASAHEHRSRWSGDDGLDVRLLEEGVVVLFRRAGASEEGEKDDSEPVHGILPGKC